MNVNAILFTVAKLAIKYGNVRLLKWCLKKRQQHLHSEWGWTNKKTSLR